MYINLFATNDNHIFRMLGEYSFLQSLKDYDKDNIRPEAIAKIRKEYITHKDFKPHIVAKASSAAEGL